MLQEIVRGDLLKNEVLIGLGNGMVLHFFPNGKTESKGLTELPIEAFFMLPLVAKLAPQEFLGTGEFSEIARLEDTLGSMVGTVEEVYRKVGPFLASKGIPAGRVARVLLEKSPIKIMKDTGEISQDTYNGYKLGLTRLITEYYPGSGNVAKKKKKVLGKVGPDGLSF
jgi:hypothetical protein